MENVRNADRRRMKYRLQDIIDIQQFQSLLDKLNEIYSFPSAIIDQDGNILTATAWQDVCTQFHRVNPESEKECRISDKYIFDHIHEANPAVSYECPHGLIDNATPIIIEGIHYGNFFTGQFFLKPPDLDVFKRQAVKYGYDEEAYLQAVKKVPVWSKKQLNSYLFFIKGLIEVISAIGLKNVKEKQTQDALRKSESLYHDLVDAAQDLIWQCDSEGKYSYLNPAWEEVFGYTVEEMLGKEFTDFQTPEYAEHDLAEFDRLLKGNSIKGLQTVHIGKDGREIHLVFNAIVVEDENGNKLGTRGTAFNITERIKSESELQKSFDLLNGLAAQVPGVVYQYRLYPDGRSAFPYSSPGMYEIYEVTPEEVREDASPVFTRLHPDDLDMIAETINESARSQTLYHSEFRVILPEQGLRWRLCDAKPSRLDDGSTLWFGVISDITDRKLVEQELINAQKKAEESDRLKSAFLANMSHEIRTPMNGILGFAELLKEPDLAGEEHDKYLGIIEKSGERMLHLINNLIDISKIEAGQMEISISIVNIHELMESAYAFFKPEAERKKMQLHFRPCPPEQKVFIETDRDKVYAILSNLIKNAIKYTNSGTIEIDCEVKGGFFEISVKDTGIGIARERLGAIFDRFVQADIADKQAREGAGLGLSIAKAYIEMLGGTIGVESEEGVGSTFSFTIPIIHTNEATKLSSAVMKTSNTIPVKSLKILIAEDDEPSELFINVIVKPYGKMVIKVETGIEAVDACRNNPDLDLVLMDIKMPEMNGYEATRKIRKFNQKVVIIAQTAYGLSGDREKSLEAGCNDYISKPFKKTELLALLQNYFDI